MEVGGEVEAMGHWVVRGIKGFGGIGVGVGVEGSGNRKVKGFTFDQIGTSRSIETQK